MNETIAVRLFGLVVWIFISFRFLTVDPPPSRAGRVTGPIAVLLLLAVLVVGAVNPQLHIVPSESVTGLYNLAVFAAGWLGITWLMLTRQRQ